MSRLGSLWQSFKKRALLNWWTLSGLREGGRLFTARLCALLWINLCPRWTLPKHPSFPRWLFVLFVIRLRFPVNVFQPELLINVIIFRLARHGFSDKMKKYVMNQTNYDSGEHFYHNQIFMLSINILTWHYFKTRMQSESTCLRRGLFVNSQQAFLCYLFMTEWVDPGFTLIHLTLDLSNCFVNHLKNSGIQDLESGLDSQYNRLSDRAIWLINQKFRPCSNER